MATPAVLYKYRAVTPYSLKALSEARVWYSKPGGLNDPHDVAARWEKDFSAKEILEDFVMKREDGSPVKGLGISDYVKAQLAKGKTHEQVLRHMDKLFLPVDKKTQKQLLQDLLYYNEVLFSGFGILSLSEVPNHPLMWAHYGGSHKGFCLGFENHETNVLGQYGDRMNYVDKMPKPKISSFAMDTGDEVIRLIAYSKSLEWSYEREWRIIKQQGNELYPYPGKLVELILGLNMGSEEEINVRKAVAESGYSPKYRRITKIEGEFELVVRDC